MKKYIGHGVWMLGMCAVAAPAQAQDEGFYFGVGAGQSEATDFERSDVDFAFAGALLDFGLIPGDITSRTDDKDAAFAFYAGYRVLPYLAVELGYTDLGTATYRGSAPVDDLFAGVFSQANAKFDFEFKGILASAVGIYPISDVFDVHGRLGLFFSQTDFDARIDLNDVAGGRARLTTRQSESAVDAVASIGAAVNLTPYWQLSLDYQLFNDAGSEDLVETNIRTLSLSFAYRLEL
jgi:hypothetical protein